ncbi:hypothetical protein ACFLZK_00400 [Patescibacteria group bacterium]
MLVSKILPIWQPIGFSTHLIAQRVGELYGVKTSHTGTLDPMAEGVIIVLLGDERLKKFEYAKWKKGYEFEIALGLSTDTYDGMGLITENSLNPQLLKDLSKESEDSIKKIANSFVGKYNQKVPPYSTKKIKGKHLHQITRNNEKITLPTKKGEIFELDFLNSKNIEISEITQNIIDRILLVTGDFRQQDIIENWKKLLSEQGKEDIKLLKFYAVTSKGLYIRSLSQDICRKLSTKGFSYSIKRTKNGIYGQKDCKSLEDIFGEDFKTKLDFVSRPNLG